MTELAIRAIRKLADNLDPTPEELDAAEAAGYLEYTGTSNFPMVTTSGVQVLGIFSGDSVLQKEGTPYD